MSLEEEDVTAFFAGLSSCDSDSSSGLLLLVTGIEVWFSIWQSTVCGTCKENSSECDKDGKIMQCLLVCVHVKVSFSHSGKNTDWKCYGA